MPILNKALAAQQQPPVWVDPNEAERQRLMARMNAPIAPQFGPEEVEARRAQNQREHDLGLLGMLSGNEQLGTVGGTVLKRALAQRDPRITERGTTDQISGKFTYSPEFLRQRDEQSLAGLDSKTAASRSAYDAERRGFADKQELQRERAEDMKEMRRISAANGQVGAFQPAGFTPDGKPVVTNTKSGMNYQLSSGPDGTPTYTPFTGVFTPKGTFDKQVIDAQGSLQSADRASQLIKLVEDNPAAFGVTGAAVGMMPGPLQGWAGGALGLTDQQRAIRAQVTRDAAMELNKIYGAAQSAGELARASAWAPNGTDDFDTILVKLRSARDWAQDSATSAGSGVMDAARGRVGQSRPQTPLMGPQGPGGALAAGLSPQEQRELQQLRQRYPKPPQGP